ncbi:MAG: hypothetical protein IT320_23460 [Anaerolineae bacterium]|nr:hypothetical protein [Anaerolineae bacterium]
MRRLGLLAIVLVLLIGSGTMVMAQDTTTTSTIDLPPLLLTTQYPGQTFGIGEAINLDLSVETGSTPQIVGLQIQDLPQDWAASFRGDGRIVDSVFVEPQAASSVELRVEPPADLEAGTYDFSVIAEGDGDRSTLPIELTIQEKAPASLALNVDLPTLRGKPDTTFRYNVTLRNDGDEDLNVDLTSEAPPAFNVTFKSASQEVTTIPLRANSTQRISVEAVAISSDELQAGTYTIRVQAQGGDVQATSDMTAEVIGTPTLGLSTPDGRLSGSAESGSQTPVTLVVSNTGSAPARAIQLTASKPSNWSVEFSPATIDNLEPGQQIEITAQVKPADKAIAGDYVINFSARSDDGASKSAEYRVTVTTSTLWGIAGIGLIGAAVVVIGLSVLRFGRR